MKLKANMNEIGLIALAIITSAIAHVISSDLTFAQQQIGCSTAAVMRQGDASCDIP